MSPRHRVLVLLALGAALFVHLTAELFPIGAQTALGRQLHTSSGQVGLLLTAYAAVAGLATLPAVHLARRAPPRVALVVAMVLLTISQVGVASSSSLVPALGLRGLGALGHGLVWSQAPLLGSSIAGPGRGGRGASAVLVGASLGLVAGAPVASGLVESVGTRAAALVLAVAAACVAVVLWVVLAGLRTQDDRPAGRGPALGSRRGAVALVCLVTVVVVVGHYVGYANLEPLLARDGWDGPLLPVGLAVFGISSLGGVALVGRAIDARPRASVVVTVLTLVVALLVWVASSGPAVVGAVVLWGVAAGALPPVLTSAAIRAGGPAADLAAAWYVIAYQVGIAAGAAAGSLVIASLGAAGAPIVAATVLAGGLVLVAATSSRLPAVRCAGGAPTPRD